jgi:hypothetical protein
VPLAPFQKKEIAMRTGVRRSSSLGLLLATALLFACNGDKVANQGGNGGSTGGKGGSAMGGATGGSANGTGGASSGSGGGSGGAVIGSGGAGKGGSPGGSGGVATGGAPGATGGAATGGAPGASGGSSDAGGSGTSIGGQGGRGQDGGLAGAGSGGAGGGSTDGGRGGGGGQIGIDGGGTPGAACASALPPVTDYTALAGPFATTTDSNTGPDGKCVIYRPKTLGENGFLHAPIVFGPGIGMQASQLSGMLLSFASHGFVVIGTGVLNGGPNDPANKAAMQNALDWIIKQNSQAGTYQGKLAVKCAISMGYSVGGTAAVELGGHEAVATTVSIHGHVATSAMHGPLLQTSGDKDTVGRPMQQQTFDKSQVQTAFGTVSGADHGYIQSANGGVERPAIIAWLRYWINGDTGARSYFWGTDCVLCKAPWLDYKTKNWQ